MRSSALAASLFLASLALTAAAPQDAKLSVGAQAPGGLNDQLEFLAGSLQDATPKDAVGVLHFWSLEGDGAKELPRLSQLQRTYGSRGLAVIAVCLAPADDVRGFVQQRGAALGLAIACPKKDDDAARRAWVEASGREVLPLTFVMSRTGKLVYVGSLSDPDFDRVMRLTVANRYDPELSARVAPAIASARESAKARNYREALASYQKALAEGAAPLLDYGFECWRMLSEQAKDDAGAKAFIRKLVDDIAKDRPSLSETVRFLASDPSVRNRDLDSARYAGDKLKAIDGSMQEPDSLSALAALAAATGDAAAAAEMQYAAFLASNPEDKPAAQRMLEVYEQRAAAAKK